MSYYIFLFLLIFAPLAFGAEELWSRTIMEVLCFTATLFYFCKPQNRGTLYRVPGFIPLMLLLCFMILQIIPLPIFLIRLLSPATYNLYEGTIGIVEMPAWITLSVNPWRTLEEFFRISAYISFYVLTIQLLTDSKRLRKTVFVVLGLCSVVALQAILQKYLNNGRIYWFWAAPPHSSFTGPFVYHNHFAGYVEMLVPVAIALFFRYRPYVNYGETWRQRFADSLASLQFNIHLLLGFAVALMGVSIFISMSRGGIISFGLSCFILLVVLSRRAKKNTSIQLVLVLIAIIFLAVGWFGWDVIDQRFGVMFDQQGKFKDLRPRIWQESISIIKDFPVTGSGWGTFGDIFPTYKTFMSENFDYHAHNDYIETFSTGGIFSLVLIGWFFASTFRQIGKTLARRHDTYAIYLTWGSLAGILAISFHSVLDFILQNGANGLYFFFLLALAVSASHTRSHSKEKTRLTPQKKGGFRFAGVLCTIILLLLTFWVNSTSLWGNREFVALAPFSWNTQKPEQQLKDIEARLDRVIRVSPLNSYTYFLMADLQKNIGNAEIAEKFYRRAIRLNPVQANYLQNFGLFLDMQGKHNWADSMMQAGVRHDLSNPDRKRKYAEYLFKNDEKEKGLQVMAAVFAQDPGRAGNDITFLVNSGISDNDIRRNLPARVFPFLEFADLMEHRGEVEQAAALYHQALTYVNNEENLWPSYFIWASSFFNKHNRYEEALDVILQAIEIFPADAGLRVRAGDLYHDMGFTHQATEQYHQALMIDQGNPQAQNQLDKLQQAVDKKLEL